MALDSRRNRLKEQAAAIAADKNCDPAVKAALQEWIKGADNAAESAEKGLALRKALKAAKPDSLYAPLKEGDDL